jgi:hypothetical protein
MSQSANIIFLHHSTGKVILRGNTASICLTNLQLPVLIHIPIKVLQQKWRRYFLNA